MISSELRLLPAHEVPILLPQAREFFKEAPIGALNESHFVSELSRQIASGAGFVLVGGIPPRGAIAGVLFTDLATAERCCMEYFWYVDRNERGSLGLRLLAGFESVLREQGVKRLMMMHLATPENDAKFSDLYARRGYRLKERVFVKEFS